MAPVTDASHGSAALKIPGNGYRRIKSAPISLPSVGSNVVRLSIKVASPASPWEGVSLILAAPSVGIFWEDLGLVSLGGATPGQYVEVQFVLPEATRALLSGVDDLTLRVVVNASQDVTVDDLRFQAPDPPSGPFYTSTPVNVGASPGAFCTAHPLSLVDLRAEFQDTWRGHEASSDGKLVSTKPTVELTFDAPVISHTVDAWFRPEPSCNSDWVRLQPAEGAEDWAAVTSLPSQPRIPADFNLVALHDISGLQFIGGAVAAGGQVMLGGFSVNATAHRSVGLVAGEAFLSSGSLFGHVLASNAGPPQSVNLQGGAWQTSSPMALAGHFARLEALSARLSAKQATGSVALQWSTLTFTGAEAGLNTFTVDATTLRQTRSVVFSIPAGSAALVNVIGADVAFENAGVTLGSATRGRILWNLADAKTVRIASISLPGSILAPNGFVAFPSGQVDGTLVARSVVGSGALHHYPLDAEAILEGNARLSPEVTLLPERPLEPNCEYTFRLAWAATSESCMLPQDPIPFRVAALGANIAEEELLSLRRDPNGLVRALSVRSGVNTLVDEFWGRYSIAFAEQPVPGVERPSPTSAEQTVSYYAQTRGGHRVLGGGYQVWRSSEGYVRKISGKQVVDFSAAPSTPIDVQTARSAAIQALGLTSLPWVAAPGTWQEPTVEFFYVPSPGGHVLVAQIDFSGAGLDLPFVVWLDATTTAVVLVHDGTSSAVDPANDEYVEQDLLTVTFPEVDANGEPIPHGIQSIFVANYLDTTSNVERSYLLSGPLELPETPPNFYAPPRPGVWGHIGQADILEIPHDSNGDGTFSIDDSAPTESIAASYWGATETFSFLLAGSWDFEGQQWRGVDGYGEAVAMLIHPATQPTPTSKRNMAFAGWESFLGTDAPFRQKDFPQEAKFPIILYPGPDGRSYLRPESTAHELGHALLSAVARRSGQGTGAPTHLGQRGAVEERSRGHRCDGNQGTTVSAGSSLVGSAGRRPQCPQSRRKAHPVVRWWPNLQDAGFA